MSRTSSDPFARTVAVLITVLVVLCGGLFALTALQGPRLSSVSADVAAGSPQQLRFVANQAVASVDIGQVRVEPAVPVAVAVSGKVITVQFTSPLHYGEHYTVTVDGVRSPAREQESTFTHEFSTAQPRLLVLQRDAAGDRIVEAGIGSAEKQTLYTGQRIEEFVAIGRSFALIEATDDGSVLQVVTPGEDGVETVPLPGVGTVSMLHASDSGRTLGFVFSSADTTRSDAAVRTLYTIDLSVGGRDLVAVQDLTGEPMHVLNWFFVPGGETLIAQSIERSVSRVDPAAEAAPLPLGQYLTISHVSADASTLTASDAFGFVEVDLASLAETRLEPSPLQGAQPYGGEVQALAESVLQHVVVYNDSTQRFDDYLVVDDGLVSRIVYGRSGSPGSILSFRVSPNEQYAAVEIDPNVATSAPDGYRGNPRPNAVTTVIVELATGSVTASVPGLGLEW
jgi:hypothetical protein